MEEKALRNNYLFTFVKFFLFVVLFCFLIEMTREFLIEARSQGGLNVNLLLVSVFSCLFSYIFIADLNDPYKQVQMFFFRSPVVSYLAPFVLVAAGLICFIISRIFNVKIDRGVFVFFGGFIFTAHLIYIAKETKGKTFIESINYLFTLSVFYLLNLVLLGVYMNAILRFRIGRVAAEGVRDGAVLIQTVFTRLFR